MNKTHKNFLIECSELHPTCKPLDSYAGYMKKLRFRCSDCSSVFTRTPNLMRKRPRCPSCATKAAYVATAAGKNAIGLDRLKKGLKRMKIKVVESTFTSLSKHADFVCANGHAWTAYPKSTLNMVYGCNVCATSITGQAQFENFWSSVMKARIEGRASIRLTKAPKFTGDTIKYRCLIHKVNVERKYSQALHMFTYGKSATPGCCNCEEYQLGLGMANVKIVERCKLPAMMLRGFEPQAVKWMTRVKKIKLDDLRVGSDKGFTRIVYKDNAGKIRMYTPDFIIPKLKCCVEVKSRMTAGLGKCAGESLFLGVTQNYFFETLKNKRIGAISAGLDFKLILLDDNRKIRLPVNWYEYSRARLAKLANT